MQRNEPPAGDFLDFLTGLRRPKQTCWELQTENTCLPVTPRWTRS